MQFRHYASLASIAAVCYLPALTGDFIFDDKEAIVTNDDVDPALSQWYSAFSHDFWGSPINHSTSHKSYRPLTVLSFRLDFILSGGRKPFLFHLTNLLLHPLVVILFLRVAEVLQQEFGLPERVSLVAGILFAVHPVHTECVAGIVGRAELWSAVFYFFAFLLYQLVVSGPDTDFFTSIVCSLLTVILGGMGMLFKEQGITVLGVCVFFEIIKDQRMFTRKKFVRLIVPVTGAVLLILLRLKVMDSAPPKFQRLDNPAAFANSSFTRIMTFNYIYSLNAWILVNPHWLCFDWSMGCIPLLESLLDLRVVAVVVLWSTLICIVVSVVLRKSSSKEKRFLLMCLVLIFVPFLPSSNLFFKVGFVVAERVLYLPSSGYCLMVALGLSKLHKLSKKLALCLVSVVIVVFVIRSFERASDWQTDEKLFVSGLTVCPQNAKVHYNVGKVKADKGMNADAEKFYREAIRLHPSYDQALNNLGNLLKDAGRLEEAEIVLGRALNASPKFAAAWMNLGIVQSNLKKYKEAEQSYLSAIKLRKKYPDAFYNLGLLYIDTEDYESAVSSFKAAIHHDGHHIQAWKNLGLLLQNMNQLNLAEEVYRQAVIALPLYSQFHSSLGVVLGKQGKYKQGKAELTEAIQMEPRNANYYGNLGVIYHLAKEYSFAKQYYEKALQLDPGLSDTKQNLLKLEDLLN